MRKSYGKPWILEFFNIHVEKNKWEPLQSMRIDHDPHGMVVSTRKDATRYNMDDALQIGHAIEVAWDGVLQVRLKNIWTKEIIPISIL